MQATAGGRDNRPDSTRLIESSRPAVLLAASLIEVNRLALAVNCATMVLVLSFTWRQLPYRLELAWAGILLLLLGSLVWRLRRRGWSGAYRRMAAESAQRLLSRAWAWSLGLGLVWGCTSLFLPWLDDDRALGVKLIALGMCSGAASLLAASPRAARVFVIAIALPYAAQFMLSGRLVDLVLCGATLILVLGLVATVQHNHRILRTAARERLRGAVLSADLDAARRNWRELSDSAEAFALFDSGGQLLMANTAYADMLGCDVALLDTHPATDLLKTSTEFGALPEARTLAGLTADSERAPTEHEFAGRLWRTSIRRFDDGHVAATHIDITPLKTREMQLLAMQTALEQALDAAQAASNAKSRFLANISHELRTPLNAVIGFSDLTRELAGAQGDHRIADYASTIYDSGCHLLSIVDELLDLARIESGKINLKETSADLCSLLREVTALFTPETRSTGRRLDLLMPRRTLMMRLDTRLIKQALINLIGNALKFSARASRPPAPVRITLTIDKQGAVQIEIQDEGSGIPAAMLDEVLKPFAQVADTEISAAQGLGLGLPLAKQFIEQHEGRLELDSTEGAGTTARIILPASRVVSPVARPAGSQAGLKTQSA